MSADNQLNHSISGSLTQAFGAILTLVEYSTYLYLREESLIVRVTMLCIGLAAAGPMIVYALSTFFRRGRIMDYPLLGGRYLSELDPGASQV